jgi:hypothetical protein
MPDEILFHCDQTRISANGTAKNKTHYETHYTGYFTPPMCIA